MHIPIIAIEKIDTSVEDLLTDLGYEDDVLNYYTDYYGDIYSAEDRKEVINSDWLKSFLKGIATVDSEKETITFLDADTIQNTQREYLKRHTEEMYNRACSGELKMWEYRHSTDEYDDYSCMFYHDYGKTAYMFIEDAHYFAGQTVRIGNIFDAHY